MKAFALKKNVDVVSLRILLFQFYVFDTNLHFGCGSAASPGDKTKNTKYLCARGMSMLKVPQYQKKHCPGKGMQKF